MKSWLNPKIENLEAFCDEITIIFDLYETAEKAQEADIHIYSVDEKMGITAREHTNERQTMKPGIPEKVDPQYIRHGSTGLIASLNVATGQIMAPFVQPTRTEQDFLRHIESIIALNDGSKHVFILDNLNTHMSESLVKLVAEYEGIGFFASC